MHEKTCELLLFHALVSPTYSLTFCSCPILFRDIQKATENFTTLLGQGSYGPVYKAKMPNGAVLAVKVLASDSKQGEKEFQTEVRILATFSFQWSRVDILGSLFSNLMYQYSIGCIMFANMSYL